MNQTSVRTRRLSRALGACVLAGTLAGTAQAQTTQPATRTLGIDRANFDTAVRPQDDFFRYVNGGWLKRTTIPDDRSNYGSFTELDDRSKEAIRRIVEEAAAGQHPAGSDLQKVGDFYASFMDTARIEQRGLEPMRPELARIAGLRSKDALPEAFARLDVLGAQTPFSMYVGQDDKKVDEYIVSLYQSGLGMPDRDYYLKPEPKFQETRAAYQQYVETVLRLTGDRQPAAGARAILALEDSLAAAQWDRTRNRDPEAIYNRMSLAQLEALTPAFSWGRYAAAAGIERTPAVLVRQPDFVQAVGRAVQRVPLDTWKRYMTFKLVDAYADDLSRPFADAQFAYEGRTLQGLEQQLPRWKRGVDAVEGAMGMLAGRIYVEQNFRPEAKARMQQLVANLQTAFRNGIDELEWMGPETRARAQEKLAGFTVKIGYPDEWPDFSGLSATRGDLVGNVMRAREFEFRRGTARLGKPVDRGEWFMTPQTVNAYYNPTMNEIVFPAAILQAPFFDMNADDAVNYGAIGGVIGHEISHGFDDEGRQYDATGALRDWWTPADNEAFKARADRLVAQYDRFQPLEGVNVNGRLTLGENIGDLSGLTVAHRAYKLSLNGQQAPVIDGFTGDQRFFLGWGQIWRRMYREANLRQRLVTDPHSPSEQRVNGVVVNMPEFYTAFGVKEGDKMYLPPAERVKLW